MNSTSIPTFIGVFTSLLTIWLLHSFLVVDNCLENGGSFQYKSGKCLLENGQVYDGNFSTILLVVYFFVGFVVSLLVAWLIRKLFKIKQ